MLSVFFSLVAGSTALRLGHQAEFSISSLPQTKEDFHSAFGKLVDPATEDFDKYSVSLNTTKHKIVFGVPVSFGNNRERPETNMTNKDARDVIRETWMKLPGMCKLEDASKPGCVFFPVFVLGSSSLAHEDKYITGIDEGKQPFPEAEEEHAAHHDMVFLHGEDENMRGGKSFAWFEYASRAYPWADYIVKCDVDSFPFPARFLIMLPEVREDLVKMKETNTTENCTSDTPYKFLGNSKGHFENGGSLYMMSRVLALAITQEGTWWSTSRANPNRGEDRMTSKGVRQLMRDNQICVTDEPHLDKFVPPQGYVLEKNQIQRVYVHEPWLLQ